MFKKAAGIIVISLIAFAGYTGYSLFSEPEAASGTLKDVLETTHARKTGKAEEGLIQHIETALELDAIQIQNLWHYLGLPTI